MTAEPDHLRVLREYPPDRQPSRIVPLGSGGGFSGARFWKLDTPSGTLCLRRWPEEHPTTEGLEFIQAVLWHATREGFPLVPLPCETSQHAGYVQCGGFLWELAPWMPGKADFCQRPSEQKLKAAMVALARFHRATASFPLPSLPRSPSAGIRERHERLVEWTSGELSTLAVSIEPGVFPEIDDTAQRVVQLAPEAARDVLPLLEGASKLGVAIQPCIRDVWHDHVFFEGDRVTGIIDFGAMRPDNVSADIARLLGSMAGDNPDWWELGLAAYQTLRRLSDDERALVRAFDRSTVVMAGLNWIDWIYRQRRVFENGQAIPGRLTEILARLEHQVGRRPAGL